MDYHFLFDIAIILVATKVLGLLTRRIELPQVVGALVAGVLLGPACFGVLHETEFLNQLAELGVIVLMFTAGLETDIKELKKSGKASFVIAVFGVVLPLGGGFLVAHFFNTDPNAMLQNVFIGVILTATSVSITVETLKELGKLSTRSGNAILGAAIIDDILGIIALTIITGMADTSVNLGMVLLKILLFFIASIIVGLLIRKPIIKYMEKVPTNNRKRFAIFAFALCLLFSFGAEHLFGVADITGAFVAGLILSNTTRVTYIISRSESISYMLLSPVFFASIGIKVVLPPMSASIIIFSILLVVVAILTKVVGCGVGAKLCKYTTKESLRIGVGMISRGEVALIVANKGMAVGLMNPNFFGPIIITVVLTTVLTPIFLKMVYKSKDPIVMEESSLLDQYQAAEHFDLASQTILDLHEKLKDQANFAAQNAETPPSEVGATSGESSAPPNESKKE